VGHQGEVGPPPVQREQLQIVSGAYCELLRELCDFCNKNSPSLLCRQRETVRKWHTCGVHKVLFIEDDDAIRLALRLALEDEGYEVVEAHDGASGLVQFGQCQPDVVLLDLRLPDLSGFEVCKAMRSSSTVPIIMVTAQTEAADMVAGLEAGADDYITKPVVPKVLSARIAAVLRRVSYESSGHQSHDEVVRFGDLELRREQGVVTKAGEELSLTRTEFRMLCEFAEHADAVLSRDQLLEHVWGYEYLGDSRLVDAHVRRLRLKIEDTPDEPQRIVTVRGLGYRLIP